MYLIEVEFFNWFITCITVLHFFRGNFLAGTPVFHRVLSLAFCPAILPGTMYSTESSSAHKIDLYNFPDTVRHPSPWSFRAQIRTAWSFNEFIQPRCVLLSRWLSVAESISRWALVSVPSISILRGVILKYPANKSITSKANVKYERCAHAYDIVESRKIIWTCAALGGKNNTGH